MWGVVWGAVSEELLGEVSGESCEEMMFIQYATRVVSCQ